jgi:alpha-beta hydrolase superfamily lysophospholipase
VTHFEELRFRAGDGTLAGTLVRPDGDGRHPWALLVPSWLPRDRDGGWDRVRHADWFAPRRRGEADGPLARLATALADVGVASLRVDPRGCGASDGTWETASLFARIDDARDAVGAMRSRSDLDLRRTAIVGHGEGAVVALSVAIGDPAIGLVGLLGAPARSLPTIWRRGVSLRALDPAQHAHPIVAAIDRFTEPLFEAVERYEPAIDIEVAGAPLTLDLAPWDQGTHTPVVALATMLHRAVVVAHGTADAWVDVSESALLVDVLREGGNDPVLLTIPGVGHDLAEADDAAIASVASAMVDRLEARELPPVLLAIEEMGGPH